MTTESMMPTLHLVAVLAPAALTGLLLARARRVVSGTTMVAPWGWAVAALVIVVGVNLFAGAPSTGAAGWRYAAQYFAAATTFCPSMAVLGAKRPQDRAWQLIVLSLLGVVSLPAIQDLLYRYGQPVALHAAWRWFLSLLIIVGVANYLPTRYGLASILYGLAQLVLLADVLTIALPIGDSFRAAAALALVALAGLLPAVGWPRRRHVASALEGLWVDFRDLYGILWALRVQERVGSSVAPGATPGARAPNEGSSTASLPANSAGEKENAAERTFAALLQRFVSRDWIDRRLNIGSAQAVRP